MTMDRKIEKKRFTTKRIIMLLGAVVFILFSGYVMIFSDNARSFNVEKEKLTISKVIKGAFQDYIPVTGAVEPLDIFYLDLTEGGKVMEKYVEEGAFVNAGDPIIKLDNPNLSLQVMSSQSSFMLAESQTRATKLQFEQNKLYKQTQLLDLNKNIMNEKRNFETVKALYEKGLESKNKFENAKEQYQFLLKSKELMVELLQKDSLTNIQLLQQADESIKQNKDYLELIKNQLANLTVRAPIKGRLTSLNAQIGQSIGGGYRLGQIDNTDSYKVKVDIDEHYISRVREGLRGTFTFDDKAYELEVKRVYVQVNNGRFQVDMHFVNNTPKGIRRGQTLHIKLDLGGESNALMVEAGGFFQTTGGQWIFVVDRNENYAYKREIKIGRQNPQHYEVLGGLKEGEKVVTSSYDNYTEVEKLNLK